MFHNDVSQSLRKRMKKFSMAVVNVSLGLAEAKILEMMGKFSNVYFIWCDKLKALGGTKISSL